MGRGLCMEKRFVARSANELEAAGLDGGYEEYEEKPGV